jgi:hypothetical protein
LLALWGQLNLTGQKASYKHCLPFEDFERETSGYSTDET